MTGRVKCTVTWSYSIKLVPNKIKMESSNRTKKKRKRKKRENSQALLQENYLHRDKEADIL